MLAQIKRSQINRITDAYREAKRLILNLSQDPACDQKKAEEALANLEKNYHQSLFRLNEEYQEINSIAEDIMKNNY